MKLDRSIQPEIKSVIDLDYIKPELKFGKNGNRYYVFSGGQAETVRIEAVLNGIAYPEHNLAVNYAMDLLTRGTKSKSAFEINQLLDLYGAFLSTETVKDRSSIVLFTLKKYLNDALPLMCEILSEASYPESEVHLLKKSEVNQFKINSRKTSFVAERNFMRLLYGTSHPYGKFSELEDHENISRDSILDAYKNRIMAGGALFMISGNISESEFEAIDNVLSKLNISDLKGSDVAWYQAPEISRNEDFKEVEDAIQTSLRVGRVLPISGAENMAVASVANVLFGGYFGSRLMSNLREKNGFTYGVGSGFITMKHTHLWTIRTEVGKEVAKNALAEIYKELEILQNNIPSDEELLRVKRYLSGNLVGKFENIHSLPVHFRNIILRNEPFDFYKTMAREINKVRPEQISKFALDNWKKEHLSELSAGAK